MESFIAKPWQNFFIQIPFHEMDKISHTCYLTSLSPTFLKEKRRQLGGSVLPSPLTLHLLHPFENSCHPRCFFPHWDRNDTQDSSTSPVISYEITWHHCFLRPQKNPALALCKCRMVQGMAQHLKYSWTTRENWIWIHYNGSWVTGLVPGTAGKKYKQSPFCLDLGTNAD